MPSFHFLPLPLTSLKRIGILQVLSVLPSCLDSVSVLVKAILLPHPDYLPKAPFLTVHLVILEAFCLPPFTTQEKLNLLCPICALQTYVHRTSQWHMSVTLELKKQERDAAAQCLTGGRVQTSLRTK